MKKNIGIIALIVVLLSAIILTACNNNNNSNVDLSGSKYVGTWKANGMTLKDQTEALENEITLILKGDGTGTFSSADETDNLTWELTSNGFKTKGDTKLTFTDDGDKIKTTLLGVALIFTKQ